MPRTTMLMVASATLLMLTSHPTFAAPGDVFVPSPLLSNIVSLPARRSSRATARPDRSPNAKTGSTVRPRSS